MGEMRATPQNPWWGVPARLLKKGLDSAIASHPGVPIAAINEISGLPGTQRTMERLSYGQPVLGPTNKPFISDDLADAIGTGLAAVPALAKVATRVPRVLATAGAKRPTRVPSLAQVGAVGDAWPQGVLQVSNVPALNKLRGNDMYSSKLLDMLPQDQSMIRAQTIQELLNKDGISGLDKTLFRDILAQNAGKKFISAPDIGNAFDAAIEPLRLDSKSFRGRGSYADHGLDNLGLDNLTNVQTNRYNTDMIHGIAENHWNDPAYFGHTRTFDQPGKRYVAEVQSDLAQMKPSERPIHADLTEANYRDKIRTESRDYDYSELIDQLPSFDEYKAIHDQRAAITPLLKNAPKRLIDEELRKAITEVPQLTRRTNPAYTQAMKDEAAAITRLYEAGNAPPEIFNTLDDAYTAARATRKNTNTEIEELNKLKELMFPTADTAEKIQGWSREVGPADGWQDFIETRRAYARDYNLPPDSGMVKETEEWASKYLLPDGTLNPQAPKSPFINPGHQGLYTKYQKEIEAYATKLGGKPHIDAAGNTWIAVPIPDKPGKIQLFSLAAGGLTAGAIIDKPQDYD